jgi:hypothetical protein
MEDLRITREKTPRKYNRFLAFIKKRKWWILSSIILFFIIFFPSECGLLIGQWINDFIVTIIKNSGF